MLACSVASVLSLCDHMDCTPSGSSVRGILQARILEWVATSCCRGSSPLRDQTGLFWGSCICRHVWASLVSQTVKCLPAIQETWVQSLGWEDPLEKEMATHFSTLAWKIPRTEEPGRLQSMRSEESDTTEWLDFFTYVISWWNYTHVCVCVCVCVCV